MPSVNQIEQATVRKHARKIHIPATQLPTMMALATLMTGLAKEKPFLGERMMASLWHTWRSLPEITDDTADEEEAENKSLYLEGLAAFFDFYFDTGGDFAKIYENLAKVAPPSPVFWEVYSNNLKQINEAAKALESIKENPTEYKSEWVVSNDEAMK